MTRPTGSKALIVAVDDEPAVLDLIRNALSRESVDILTFTDPQQALAWMSHERPDVVLLDLTLPQTHGMEVLEQVRRIDSSIPVALLAEDYSTESAIEAVQNGACDYLAKPFSIELLRERIGKILATVWQRNQVADLERQLLDVSQFQGIVGRSPAILEIRGKILLVAPHFRTALITGPTGAGKELAAGALHRLSPGRDGPFVVCNCPAMDETQIESELFGQARDAYPGAPQDRPGLFESAAGGTILLDEVDDLPRRAQTRLLRVLQQFEIQPAGSTRARKVDVRVIAATSHSPAELVAEGKLPIDLCQRLAAVEISMPPLTERIEDLPLLVRHFLARFSAEQGKALRGLTRRAHARLVQHSWTGNVRELENVLAHACMIANGEWIDIDDLPERLIEPQRQNEAQEQELLPLEEVVRSHIHGVLIAVGGNRVRAARALGIGRTTLYRFLGRERAGRLPKPPRRKAEKP